MHASIFGMKDYPGTIITTTNVVYMQFYSVASAAGFKANYSFIEGTKFQTCWANNRDRRFFILVIKTFVSVEPHSREINDTSF